MADRQVFVTVGTTKFDALISAVLQNEIADVFRKNGYKRLLLQIGHGDVDPASYNCSGITVDYYRLKNSLEADMAASDLIISHAGAGSCLEALEIGKPLIVVINQDLMDNHQAELANALAVRGHVYSCTPSTLLRTLIESNLSALKPFPPADSSAFKSFLDGVMEEH